MDRSGLQTNMSRSLQQRHKIGAAAFLGLSLQWTMVIYNPTRYIGFFAVFVTVVIVKVVKLQLLPDCKQ